MKARGAPSPSAEANVSVDRPAPRHRRRWLPWAVGLAVLLGLFGFAADWLLHRLAYVSETDARVAAEIIILSTTVPGRIVEMPVAEGARVEQGQPLVRIDDRDARLRLQELEARLAALQADDARLGEEIALVRRRTDAQLESEQAKLAAARALVESLEVQHRFAESELKRAESLSASGVLSRKDLDRIRTDYLQAQQEALRARAQAATAAAELGAAEAEGQRLRVLEQERALLAHRGQELRAAVERARIEADDHLLRAPIAGVISRTFVAAGEYVSPGQRLALLHDPEQVWVEALVKETDVARLAVGQPVAIHVDAYPDQTFRGEVARIGHAATSEFSLLPNPNPSGNFTKVTQRLPVKIAVPQDEGRLRPGMMVEVDIDVR